ncbi:putative TIM-barrel fold metal-dependent hydrolase [Paraburkholderia sp. JPY681]|nr:putative TIM-barrel fold metal-dependent hydrolase [Paraburkholderia atlantica]
MPPRAGERKSEAKRSSPDEVDQRSHPGALKARHQVCPFLSWSKDLRIRQSGLGGQRDAPWNEAENRRIIRDAIAIFGAGRCMFASNFPIVRLRATYPNLVRTFATAMEEMRLDATARRAIWHDNAIRIYRIVRAGSHRTLST